MRTSVGARLLNGAGREDLVDQGLKLVDKAALSGRLVAELAGPEPLSQESSVSGCIEGEH